MQINENPPHRIKVSAMIEFMEYMVKSTNGFM
jgi:hypothetical protein